MLSILKYLDGSELYSLGVWLDDGKRLMLLHKVSEDEMEETKRLLAVDWLRVGIDPSLQYLPIIHNN